MPRIKQQFCGTPQRKFIQVFILHLSISLLSKTLALTITMRETFGRQGLLTVTELQSASSVYRFNYKLLTCSSCICRSNLILSIDSPSSISLAWLAVSLSSARAADSSVTCGKFQTLSNAVYKQLGSVQNYAYRPS